MKKLVLLASASALFAGSAFAQASTDLPSNADAGECFARVLIPETTQAVLEEVVDRPETQEITVVPARYETITEQVLIKDAETLYKVIPATYSTVTEQVLIEEERTETIVIPAEFETFSEQVLVRPAYTTWKPGSGLLGLGGGNGVTGDGEDTRSLTGELLCKVEIPAQYDTVTRTRIKSPERTETRLIPSRYDTVTREVVSRPAEVVQEAIPAVYDTITVQRLVSPTREEVVTIPATYKTVEKRVVTGGGGLEWREVLCDTNSNSAKIREVQNALSTAGYPVATDGQFGSGTLRAMENFQRANGLPVGYLTVSTVQALGVNPY